MKTYTKYLTINTNERIDFVNITLEAEKAVKESGIKEGIILINSMHITNSVFINDNENGLLKILKWLGKTSQKSLIIFSSTGRIMGLLICGGQYGKRSVVATTRANRFWTWESIFMEI
jgi:hypothetical protein